MRRTVVPLALVLALVSGVVLAEARLVLLAPIAASGSDARVPANEAVISRFYAAVNAALATGDTDSLSGLVDVDFVDHTPRPGTTADRAGLVKSVQSLHLVAPDLRLTMVDVLAQGDRVAARIGIGGRADSRFLRLPLVGSQLWSSFDVFRIETGRIVEHWSAPATLARFAPLLDVTVPVARPTRKALTLERWAYAPDAGETLAPSLGFLVVLVDAGTLTIAVDSRSSGGVRQIVHGHTSDATDDRLLAPGEADRLEPGDAAVIPQGDWVAVRNNGAVAAVALVLQAIAPVTQADVVSGTGASTAATRIVRQTLAGGLTANLPAGEATVAIGRAGLAAGTGLPAHRVDVTELVAVESGFMTLAADDGAAWVTSQVTGTHRADGETVPAGGGVLADAGTVAMYGASGDESLGILLVTVGSVGIASPATGVSTASPVQATPR